MNAQHNTQQNTVSLKPAGAVDAGTFSRLRAAGFAWDMQRGEFSAPATPGALQLAGDMAGQLQTTPAAWTEYNGASLVKYARAELFISDASPLGAQHAGQIYGGGPQCSAIKPAEAAQASGEAESAGTSGEENHAQASGEEIDADEAAQASGEEKTDDDTDEDGAGLELCDDIERATYSPEDNKIRLYPARRLDADIYARVKAAGFIWAAKQGVFVAPAWTPARADLAEALAGELGDEDTTLAERAAERADRFEDYQGKRAADAESARRAVDAIAQNIPFGQPILVGHHSERHARRDAQRIEDGMRRAVKMWDTAEYWTRRAAGAIQHARYKERPDVRARRIKTIEAAQRKNARGLAESQKWLQLWTRPGLTLEQARALANVCWLTVARADGLSWTAYDVLRPDSERGTLCPAWTVDQVQAVAARVYPRSIAHAERWDAHYKNRLAYERAMLEDQGAAHLLEKKKRPAPPPLLNYRAPEGFTLPSRWTRGGIDTLQQVDMTKAEYAAIYDDYRGTRTLDGHRIRTAYHNRQHVAVFLTDSKTHPRPEKAAPATEPTTPDEDHAEPVQASGEAETIAPAETVQASGEDPQTMPSGEEQPAQNIAAIPEPAPAPSADPGAAFAAMRDSLRAGVQVVAAPQLFPTPAPLAARMVELADIQPGARVLEPSAGTGRLLQAIGQATHSGAAPDVVAVEINRGLVDTLARGAHGLRGGLRLHNGDFLQCDAAELGRFDRVVMNPPFANGADIVHIKHAASLLKPGGRLVALCANGPRQRAALQPLADYWEDLPAGSFSEAGTGVNVALLVIEAPAATGTDDDAGEAGQVQASGEEKAGTPSGEDPRGRDFDPTTPANYARIAGSAELLDWWQDVLDHYFQGRHIDIRNALRALGWDGPKYQTLTKEQGGARFTFSSTLKKSSSNCNAVGVTWQAKGEHGAPLITIADDITKTPEQIAAELDRATQPTPLDDGKHDDKHDDDDGQGQDSGEAAARPARKPKKARAYDFPNAQLKIMEDGTCREFPKWCPMISVVRSRAWATDALRQLRAFNKAKRATDAGQKQAAGEDPKPTPSGEEKPAQASGEAAPPAEYKAPAYPSDSTARELVRAVEKVDLLKRFDYLKPATDNPLVTAAKNIRTELKRAWPGVKFSVTTERFSMGDAIRIHWTDGPTSKQVDAIANKYKAGSFDGMEDIYNYNTTGFNALFGAAKYITTSRENSDAAIAAALDQVARKYGAPPFSLDDYKTRGAWQWQTHDGYRLDREVHQALSAADHSMAPLEQAI